MNTNETPLPFTTLRCPLGKVRFIWDAPADFVRVYFNAADVSRTPHLDFNLTEWNGIERILKHGDTWIMSLERGRMLWRILRRGGWEVAGEL